MKKLRIGVLGPADIAKRRMIPALLSSEKCEYAGVAVALSEERGAASGGAADEAYKAGLEKASKIKEEFGGDVYEGFASLIAASDVDAVYVALPPYLHAKWGKEVLRAGKHLLMEKPFTVSYDLTSELIDIARASDLAVIENFGFVYHPQFDKIRQTIDQGTIGELRMIRTNFGFPHRGAGDFRYKKELGGGAVLDCGCYTLKLATLLLGDDMKITDHALFKLPGDDLDIAGAVTAIGASGVPAQLSFSMDQQYCCDVEVWGSKGCIRSPRIYTAPAGYEVVLSVTCGMETQTVKTDGADQFALVADKLAALTEDAGARTAMYEEILAQSRYVTSICE